MTKQLPIEDLNHILAHTQEVWKDLNHAKIFITGGTGFFGTWLLESFAAANREYQLHAKVLVLTRNAKKFKEKFPHLAHNAAIQFLEGDVRNFDFPAGEFSHIIHAATEASAKLNAEDPLKMLDVILTGTKRVFDFAVHTKAQSVLLTSSGAVYGKQPSEITHITEDYLGSPDIQNSASAYGVGKRTAEHLANLYHAQHQLNIKIARCFAFVGPLLPLDIHFAIGNFIRDGLAGKTIRVNGDGSPYRSYQYAADLTIWLWKILCFGKSCYPYNVGSDEDLSIAELAKSVANGFSPTVEVEIAKSPTPDALPERYVPSIERAKKELDLQNWIDLKEAIQRTIYWYQ